MRSSKLQARLGFAALFLAFLLVCAAFPVDVWANPDYEVTYWYYADASKTGFPVGMWYWTCTGLVHWGVQTPYYDRFEGQYCPDPWPWYPW